MPDLAKERLASGWPWAVEDGIPVLLPDGGAEHGATAQKRQQATFTDHAVDGEYEITRPHGTPLIHALLLTSKLERGLQGLGGIAAGGTALVVCGGSGMDAEFLARAGARVVCADISARGAARTRERAERFGLPIEAVVADAELLPFRDRAFDLVWVHDGLHHLDRPETALREMVRVAAKAISVNEPARAAMTEAAVRIGLADEQEEAGNRVARMDARELVRQLSAGGFTTIAAERYAMVYRHEAGPLYRCLSRRSLVGPGWTGVRVLNSAFDRLGNKLSVRAVRKR